MTQVARALPLLLATMACAGGGKDGDGDGDGGLVPDGLRTKVDFFFLIDNSPSMVEESTELVQVLDAFVAGLPQQLSWEARVITTTVDTSGGDPLETDPGEAGLLFGDVVEGDGPAPPGAELSIPLLCEATCWNAAELASDPDYVCGDPWTVPSLEMLDCTCGFDDWTQTPDCGSGNEEPLEAALLAMCRGTEGAPGDCVDPITPLDTAELGQDPLLREGTVPYVLVLTDEGDSSRRLNQGEEGLGVYADLFASFPVAPMFSVMGPAWDGVDGSCIQGATTWGATRLRAAALDSGGAYVPLYQVTETGSCEPTPVEEFIQAVLGTF